jgi:hypothetical protein
MPTAAIATNTAAILFFIFYPPPSPAPNLDQGLDHLVLLLFLELLLLLLLLQFHSVPLLLFLELLLLLFCTKRYRRFFTATTTVLLFYI